MSDAFPAPASISYWATVSGLVFMIGVVDLSIIASAPGLKTPVSDGAGGAEGRGVFFASSFFFFLGVSFSPLDEDPLWWDPLSLPDITAKAMPPMTTMAAAATAMIMPVLLPPGASLSRPPRGRPPSPGDRALFMLRKRSVCRPTPGFARTLVEFLSPGFRTLVAPRS